MYSDIKKKQAISSFWSIRFLSLLFTLKWGSPPQGTQYSLRWRPPFFHFLFQYVTPLPPPAPFTFKCQVPWLPPSCLLASPSRPSGPFVPEKNSLKLLFLMMMCHCPWSSRPPFFFQVPLWHSPFILVYFLKKKRRTRSPLYDYECEREWQFKGIKMIGRGDEDQDTHLEPHQFSFSWGSCVNIRAQTTRGQPWNPLRSLSSIKGSPSLILGIP